MVEHAHKPGLKHSRISVIVSRVNNSLTHWTELIGADPIRDELRAEADPYPPYFATLFSVNVRRFQIY